MVPENLQSSVLSPDEGLKALQWEIFVEKAGIWGEADFVKNGFVDHINTTKDTTDYLWYTTRLVYFFFPLRNDKVGLTLKKISIVILSVKA